MTIGRAPVTTPAPVRVTSATASAEDVLRRAATRNSAHTFRDRLDQAPLAGFLALCFAGFPMLSVIDSSLANNVAIGLAMLALVPILVRVHTVLPLFLVLFALFSAYMIDAYLSELYSVQGAHAGVTTGVVALVVVLFATYGRDLVQMDWWRQGLGVMITVGLLVVAVSHLEKNSKGASIVYLLALAMVLLVSRRPSNAWFYVYSFFLSTGALALVLGFRGLIAYTAIMVVGYWGSMVLPKAIFWLAGIAGASAWIGTIIWFYLHVFSSDLAISINRFVTQETGRPSTSGRQILWPAITQAVGDQKWLGLGAGALPRDILQVDLSSHSTYMQTYLQMGFVGVGLVVLVLVTVWTRLARASTQVGRFGAAIFLMFVVHNSSEVLMFQNRLAAAIPAWAAIGLAYALSRAPAPVPGRARPISE